MRNNRPIHISYYIISDIVASVIVWISIGLQRRHLLNEEPQTIKGLFTHDNFFILSLLLVIAFWLSIYSIIGSYNKSVYKKSRLAELTATFIECFIGSIILLFVLFLNDSEQHYSYFYITFFSLLLLTVV